MTLNPSCLGRMLILAIGLQSVSSNTIAVLPFVNMSATEENEYFSDGITEEIINALAQLDGLKVISPTFAFYFKEKRNKEEE